MIMLRHLITQLMNDLVEKGCYDIRLIREAAFTCLCEGSNDREEFEEDALTDSELHRWPGDPTSGNVKLLLPPRQSRGNSHYGLESSRESTREIIF